ncbi:MAG: hypothetical protein ACI9UH_000858, partial [Gammaproteobacteria bacterium]
NHQALHRVSRSKELRALTVRWQKKPMEDSVRLPHMSYLNRRPCLSGEPLKQLSHVGYNKVRVFYSMIMTVFEKLSRKYEVYTD